MRQTRIWLAWLLWGMAGLANAADNAPESVLPMGVFSAVRSTADHTYGQKVRLWRTGTRVVGEVLYWDGNLEAQRGRFSDGVFLVDSGELRFRVTIVRTDVQPNTRVEASFDGYRARGGVHGKVTWHGRGGSENWLLLPDRSEKLENYNSVEDWLKAFPLTAKP